MPSRKRYSFRINETQTGGLKAIKESEDISESEQIRQAINDWLTAHLPLDPESLLWLNISTVRS